MNRRQLAALLLVPALSLTACGGDDGGSTAQPPKAGTSAGAGSGPGGTGPGGENGGGNGNGQAGGGSGGGGSGGSGTEGGGSGGSGGGAGGTTPDGPPPEAVKAFASCMRKNGVDIPADINQWKPPATPSGEMQRAMAVCMQEMAKAAPR